MDFEIDQFFLIEILLIKAVLLSGTLALPMPEVTRSTTEICK